MNKTVFRFKFFDMPVSVPRSSLVASVVLVIVCTGLAIYFVDLTPLDSLIAGILAMMIHMFSSVWHQYGHYFAAKRTGYPSTGVRAYWFLGATLYPRDELALPPQIHMKRALGGSVASALLLVLFLNAGAIAWTYSPMTQFLLGWGIFIQAGVFLAGGLIPAKIGGFQSDGWILLRSFREMRSQSS